MIVIIQKMVKNVSSDFKIKVIQIKNKSSHIRLRKPGSTFGICTFEKSHNKL